MINLQPLIEKFKKAVYGRDVRQSIVDLAQAIGDNHNEQEGLRDEVKSLDSDIKVKKEEAEQAINIAISSVNSAKTEAEKSISSGINALNSGKEEIEDKTNSKIQYLETKTESLKKQITSTAENKISDVNQTINSANESNRILKETIQQSTNERKNLDGSIQQSTAKGQELETHIAEINQIIADGKAVTKRDLLNVERLIPPKIVALGADDFIWYISQENINFYSSEDIAQKTQRVEAYCNIKLSEVKEKITRDGNMASLNISGWDRMLANNIPFITSNTQVFVNITGLKIITPLPFCSELTDNGVKVDWISQSGETTEKDASIFVKLVSFY